MKRPALLIFLIFAGMILNAQIDNCAHTNTSWKNEAEAIETVENGSFARIEMIEGEDASWVESVHFYSCDEGYGFLIVKGKRKRFIHQNVPLKVWENFKSAHSKGGYYNFYIKNKFKLQKHGNDQV